VKCGKFREDLFYRLKVVSIYLPPLRERRGDIPLLIEHFRKELSGINGREVPTMSRAARQALMAHDWPGNIRQLRNAIERMFVLDTDGLLDVDDLPDDIAPHSGEGDDGAAVAALAGADALIGKPLADVERFYIQRALEVANGKREEAASMLGIGERTLYRKIKEYGLRQ
jgi:two-component system response regulator HydG